MKRLLWLGVGLAIGALVVRAVSKKARSYSPGGIASAVRDTGRNALDSVRDFVDDVRDGMHEREHELHAAFLEGRPLDAGDDEEDEDIDDIGAAFGGPAGDLAAAPGSRPDRDPTEDPSR